MRNLRSVLVGTLLAFILLVVPAALAQAPRVDIEALNGSITHGAITCANTETAVPATALTGRRAIAIVNISDADIYIGATGVTTANGLEVAAETSLTIDAGEDIAFFCISAAGGKVVRYLEIR